MDAEPGYLEAFGKALQSAPRIEVDVNPMTGAASAPFPEWLFGEGVRYGEALARSRADVVNGIPF